MFEVLAAEAAGRLSKFNAQNLANTAWAFARLEHPAPALFEALAAESAGRLAEFNAQNLANTAWAFAAAGHQAPELFEQLADLAWERNLERFRSEAADDETLQGAVVNAPE